MPERAPHGGHVAARHGNRLAGAAVHDQRQLAARPAVDRADAGQVDEEAAVDAQELAAAELLLELVDAAHRGLQAAFLGHEPDRVAVRFRVANLGPVQEDHALAGHADDARRAIQEHRLRPLVLDRRRPCRLRTRRASRSAGRPRKTGRSVIRHGSRVSSVTTWVEPTQLRSWRACFIAWRARPSTFRPGCQRTVGSSAGTRAGTPRTRLAPSSAITTLPLASRAASRLPGVRVRPRERRGELGAAVTRTLTQACAGIAHGPGQPPGRLGRKVVAPGRDVEDRDGVARDGVAHGHAGADPLVEAAAPVLGPADQHRSGRLERRAHPVRARRPLRPARPRRHVAVVRVVERLLVALNGQKPSGAVGDGDDAADALHVGRDRGRGAAELREDDLVLERVLGRRLILRRGGRRHGQAGVDVVLLATAVPGRRDLGPDAANAVVAREELVARCRHGLVPLRVGDAVPPRGRAHPSSLHPVACR